MSFRINSRSKVSSSSYNWLFCPFFFNKKLTSNSNISNEIPVNKRFRTCKNCSSPSSDRSICLTRWSPSCRHNDTWTNDVLIILVVLFPLNKCSHHLLYTDSIASGLSLHRLSRNNPHSFPLRAFRMLWACGTVFNGNKLLRAREKQENIKQRTDKWGAALTCPWSLHTSLLYAGSHPVVRECPFQLNNWRKWTVHVCHIE